MSVKYKTANVAYSLNSLVHFMRLTWFSSILRIQMTEENEPRCFKMQMKQPSHQQKNSLLIIRHDVSHYQGECGN